MASKQGYSRFLEEFIGHKSVLGEIRTLKDTIIITPKALERVVKPAILQAFMDDITWLNALEEDLKPHYTRD